MSDNIRPLATCMRCGVDHADAAAVSTLARRHLRDLAAAMEATP